MKKVNKTAELHQAIAALEKKSSTQKKDLQETFTAVSENFKPLNLVKSGVRSVFSGENKEDLFNILLGLGSGFLGRKMLLGKSNGLVGKTVGRAIQWGMAGLVSKNAETIKEKAGLLIDKLFRRHKPESNHVPVSPPDSSRYS
jgi:hypothetical protein